MRLRKVWLQVLGIASLCLVVAQVSQATYVRGYVRPSGDGDSTCISGQTCTALVSADNTLTIPTDLFGVAGTQTFNYDFLQYLSSDQINNQGVTNAFTIAALSLDQLNLKAGDLLTFTFSALQGVPTDTLGNVFGILPCQESGSPATPTTTIVNSLGDFVSNKCTNTLSTDTLITDESVNGNSIKFTLASGSAFPSKFAFSFPNGQLPTGIDVASGSVTSPMPEPASLSLLALGLVGLGAWRKKRTV
jgi:PEP-CTERM motif